MNNESYLKIKEDLTALGVKKGDDLLIHSSFKSLGPVEGGIETLIQAILSVLGDSGTLIFPTITYANVNPEPPVLNPVFDLKSTPSIVGAITNYFREMPGVERSLHPSHSCCALGARQHDYVKDHYKDSTPVGENSPFRKLFEFGGKVLFLGCLTRSNTSMHGVEEYANAPYCLSENTRHYVLIDGNEKRTEKDYRYHFIGQRGFGQRYDRLEEVMAFDRGKVLAADCALVDAPTMWKVGKETIEKSPYYFVEKK